MKVYYISQKREKRNTAGVKAPSDVSAICKNLGYQEFLAPSFPSAKNKVYQKLWLLFFATWNWINLKNTIEDDSVVIYQHPMYGNRVVEKMIPFIQKRKHAKFVALIHDLESLRGGIDGVTRMSMKTSDVADNLLLKKFDILICHNEHMRQYLIKQGFAPERIVNLEIFDYLTEINRIQYEKGKDPSIAIAGNLAIGKCSYIYSIFENGNNCGLRANLYGINFQEDNADKNMIYHGSFMPEELPEKLEGDFGLVWDGNSAETCAGNTGEYLKYNNPHKASLYLASGMPVIVWSKAAISKYVLKNEIGIVVDSLYELEDKIKNIQPPEYEKMCRNVQKVSEKLRSGYYTKCAIEKALALL